MSRGGNILFPKVIYFGKLYILSEGSSVDKSNFVTMSVQLCGQLLTLMLTSIVAYGLSF